MSRTLPAGFREMLDALRFPPVEGLADTLASTDPSLAIRANAAKGFAPWGDAPVPWLPDAGRYLDSRPLFTADPRFHQGLYYVQDAASMFIGHVVGLLTADGAPVTYLDACAAPGGKTTCALGTLPPGSLVVANEVAPARAAVLRENIIKWGDPGVIVTRADACDIAAAGIPFDIVAADVPCSGEGMMRKEPEAIAQWSPGLIASCAARQRRIVDSLWQAVRPGGHLIYSTCTFNRTENEDIAAYIAAELGGEPVAVPVDPAWNIAPGIDTGIPCCRFIPGRTRGEGLFMTVFRKPADAPAPRQPRIRRPSRPEPLPVPFGDILRSDFIALTDGDRIDALPRPLLPVADILAAARGVDVIHRGVPLAVRRGRDLVPAHPLAMSSALRRGIIPEADVDEATALDYLRCGAVSLPGAPRGHILLTFRDRPLGFVKNLGNRANNLYPRDWRIRNL